MTSSHQIQKLKYSGTTGRLLETLTVQTRQGRRKAIFLEYTRLGHWLQMFEPEKLPAGHPLRETIPRFQQAALRIVSRMATGQLKPITPEQLAAASGETKLTITGVQHYVEFVKERVERVERVERAINRPYIDAEVSPDADAGVINIPFTCLHGQSYIIRLRQKPWHSPEIVAIVPFSPEEG